jgi:signal transduction histidine kinase/FixJ family two-component response regulator
VGNPVDHVEEKESFLQGKPGQSSSSGQSLFAGGGEMGRLMRSFDWSEDPLGPPETWSPALQSTTRLVLANCSPMLLWWEPDFLSIYNDAYIPVLGDKHPHAALGKPLRECWSEVFPVLEPLVRSPLEGGPPTWMEDIMLEVNRFGFVEETHFTIGYSPVPDPKAPRGIGGVLATVHEITEKVLSERRVLVLRDISTDASEAKTAEEACRLATTTLAKHANDIPFALIYLFESNGETAHLAAHTGIQECAAMRPEAIDLTAEPDREWPLASCRTREEIVAVPALAEKFGCVPQGPWFDPPHMAAVVPIKSNIAHQLAGFFVAGISPRLRYGDSYRGFLELASAQIAAAIANARAYQEERKRAEALAEIDRAKTIFFTNISHEFRTPLTLIMAPLEDALAAPKEMPVSQRKGLAIARRNSLRLLKLVNTLLDFSRIEAGRMQAVFEPVDLAALTADLASVFRSAVERAGVELIVDCPPLPEPVYVDREMWEKIVLNLLSNAFKFTLEGRIEVALKATGNGARLEVRDTGSGIAADDVPYVFERFYRATNTKKRSHEGSGIGVALVRDLVRFNSGTVQLESALDRGSIFTVTIPFGSAHLPSERIGAARTEASTMIGADAFLEEALGWLPSEAGQQAEQTALTAGDPRSRPRIVLAEDNSDMREYLERLLAGAYRIECVADGESAFESALRELPDLILTDVMMPRLDGFGLLKASRGNAQTTAVPVILLSARAGEESRVEGLAAGADDYLIKPFSARELVARVENQLALSRLRRTADLRLRESEERFRAFVSASSDVVYRMSPDWSEMWHLEGRDFIPDTESPNGGWLEKYVHLDDRLSVIAAIQEAIRRKAPFAMEHRVLRIDGSLCWIFSRAVPILNAGGEIVEWIGAASDITAHKQAEQALLHSERLATLGRMAATIAHEINNPLESVTNLLFLADHTDNVPQSVHRFLQMADTELQRVAHIARQSLGFYRDSNAPALTSLNLLLDSAIDLMRGKISEKQAVVEKDWLADVKITALAGELRQVFSNLLANSLDAIDFRGKIRIRVSASTAADRGHPRSGAGCVRIIFMDNGRGITPAIRARIFEPFFTTKGAVGTGLGLWVTKQIVNKHGGSIKVRSRSAGAGRGTAFSIVLPVDAGSALAA